MEHREFSVGELELMEAPEPVHAPSERARPVTVPDRWCIHSYYTVSPYAPDGSGRLLLAGADLDRGIGEVFVLAPGGEVLHRFGANPVHSGFFHTGFWQTWGPGGRSVYYQSGTLEESRIVRRDLETGREMALAGDMEGAPPDGEPIVSGLMGMLYAAGYGEGVYRPEAAPVPFQARERHGLFEYSFDPPSSRLRLSVAEILERHPQRDLLLRADRDVKDRHGERDGLTLMAYCVRWSPDGSRLLFYFGNHCTVPERGEPRIAYVFTADRSLGEIHLALDLSFGRKGVHWSWHPDGVHLVGYGPDPDEPSRMCLAQVRYDGTGYRRISRHASGGHPSVSPADHRLLVTDTGGQPGEVLFIDTVRDRVVQSYKLPRRNTPKEPPGRNRHRVCHHPVFDRTGRRVLVNTLPGEHAVPCELPVPELTGA